MAAVDRKIFVSVGRTSTSAQEDFVRAIEERLRVEGLKPCTVGRNTWSNIAPLKQVMQLMDECTGVVIIAFERTYYPQGMERRGSPDAIELKDVRLPTSFNQIEAAMGYAFGHPMLVIAEQGLREEGLLERGNDWFVQRVKIAPESLSSAEFAGILAAWKEQVVAAKGARKLAKSAVGDMTIVELAGSLKVSQLWATLGALVVIIGGAFSLGAKLFGVMAIAP